MALFGCNLYALASLMWHSIFAKMNYGKIDAQT